MDEDAASDESEEVEAGAAVCEAEESLVHLTSSCSGFVSSSAMVPPIAKTPALVVSARLACNCCSRVVIVTAALLLFLAARLTLVRLCVWWLRWLVLTAAAVSEWVGVWSVAVVWWRQLALVMVVLECTRGAMLVREWVECEGRKAVCLFLPRPLSNTSAAAVDFATVQRLHARHTTAVIAAPALSLHCYAG